MRTGMLLLLGCVAMPAMATIYQGKTPDGQTYFTDGSAEVMPLQQHHNQQTAFSVLAQKGDHVQRSSAHHGVKKTWSTSNMTPAQLRLHAKFQWVQHRYHHALRDFNTYASINAADDHNRKAYIALLRYRMNYYQHLLQQQSVTAAQALPLSSKQIDVLAHYFS